MRLLGLLCCCALIGSAWAEPSQESERRELQLKAGFIYNFIRYSESDRYINRHQQAFTLCAYSQAFIAAAALTLDQQQINNQPLRLQLLDSSAPAIAACDVIYLSEADDNQLATTVTLARQQQSLLIGESEDFLSQGGHIRFFRTAGKVRFEVAPEQLKQNGIRLSSKVLRLGRIYQGS